MLCPQCRFDNRSGVSFSEECGARLDIPCSSCGAAVPAGRKFCGVCGKALGGATARRVAFASPESYTPKHLAEKILTSKAALEGERKQVTVLFADLKGSMELLADRDPEEARKLLDPVLEHMMEAVHRYEGTVNQVMGDGIMALFGAPLAHEDHAVRACYAALRMQEAVQRYAEERRRAAWRADPDPRGPELRRGGGALHRQRPAHGLHGGRPDHAPGRAHGAARDARHDPADAATRCARRGLRAGEAARARAGQGPRRAGRGLRADAARAAARTRLQAAAARGLTRFVGRDAEMEQLRRALEQAGAGHGQIVAVVGRAGRRQVAARLGVHPLASHARTGWCWRPARCPTARRRRYLPVIDLLKATSRSRTATTTARSARR